MKHKINKIHEKLNELKYRQHMLVNNSILQNIIPNVNMKITDIIVI